MAKRIDIDPEFLRRAHWVENKHVIAIARELGYSRAVVYARMKEHGIPWRDQSAAKFLISAMLAPEERKRRAQAAHEAIRGKKRPASEKARRAVTNYSRGPSPIEAVFLDAFLAAGYKPEIQFPVGIYNLDIAFPEARINVEIDPGNWHKTKRKQAVDVPRDAYLRENGWTVIRWSGKPISLANPRLADVAKEHVARFEVVHGNPPAPCQNGVVPGGLDESPACANPDNSAVEAVDVDLGNPSRLAG